jgi:hypothetical protein
MRSCVARDSGTGDADRSARALFRFAPVVRRIVVTAFDGEACEGRVLMLNKFGVCTALGLLTLSTLASAADMRPLPPPVPAMPRGGFFIGLGGSYNSVKYDQELYAAGVSNVYSGSTLIAFGQAGGPANPFHDNQSAFAPEAQAGFFSPIGNSSWLWGAKFRYKYLGLTSTERLVDSPQTGSFTNTGAAPAATTFTGNVIIQQSQMRLDHEIVFLAFLGQSFGSTNVYLGLGLRCSERKASSITRSAMRISMARTPAYPAPPPIIPPPTGSGELRCRSA